MRKPETSKRNGNEPPLTMLKKELDFLEGLKKGEGGLGEVFKQIVNDNLAKILSIIENNLGKEQIDGFEEKVESIFDTKRSEIIQMLILTIGKEINFKKNDLLFIGKTLRLPNGFDINIIPLALRGKLNSKQVVQLLQILKSIDLPICKTFLKNLITFNIENLTKSPNNENDGLLLGFLKGLKIKEADIEILEEITKEINDEGLEVILGLVVSDEKLYIENVVKIVIFFIKKGYEGILSKTFGTSKEVIGRIKDYIAGKNKIINSEQKYELLKEISSISGKYIIYKILFASDFITEIEEIKSKKVNPKSNNEVSVEKELFETFREFLRINETDNGRNYIYIDFIEGESKGIVKKGSIGELFSNFKNLIGKTFGILNRKSNTKYLKYLNLMKLLGFDTKERKIPIESDFFNIIKNTKTFDGRKIIFDLYFKGIKGIKLEYNLLLDSLLKYGLITELKDFTSKSLTSFLEDLDGNIEAYFNLNHLIETSLNNDLEVILSEFMRKVLKLPRNEVEEIMKNFNDERNRIDFNLIKKFKNCNIDKLLIFTKAFGISVYDVENFLNLAEFLQELENVEIKINGKYEKNEIEDSRIIEEKIKIFLQLFPELHKDVNQLNNRLFLEAIRDYEIEILRFLLNEYLFYKKLEEKKNQDLQMITGEGSIETDETLELEQYFGKIRRKGRRETKIGETSIMVIKMLEFTKKFIRTFPEENKNKGEIAAKQCNDTCSSLVFEFDYEGFIKGGSNPFFRKGARVENFIVAVYKYVYNELSKKLPKGSKRNVGNRNIRVTGVGTEDFNIIGGQIIINIDIFEDIGKELGDMANTKWEERHLIHFGISRNISFESIISRLRNEKEKEDRMIAISKK